jgi:hypothetical protein
LLATSHRRYVTFPMAEVAVSRRIFAEILLLRHTSSRRFAIRVPSVLHAGAGGARNQGRSRNSALKNPRVWPLLPSAKPNGSLRSEIAEVIE